MEVFAGCEGEEGSVDGKVKDCQFWQQMGIYRETETVIYISESQTNSINICTKIVECAELLNSIGQFYDPFSIHCKGVSYLVKCGDKPRRI